MKGAIVFSRRRFLAAAGVAAAAARIGAYAWLRSEAPLALACIDFVMKEEAKSIMMGAMPRAAARDGMYASVVALRKGSVGVIGSDQAVVNSVAGALRT